MGSQFHFGRFILDPANRRLLADGEPVEINSRYLDALALMVAEPEKLIAKDRFMDEVWRGIPVTDEALTQCIRTLRKSLGDDAARPEFIETVPKHGYRFIAEVEQVTLERSIPPVLQEYVTIPIEVRLEGQWQRIFLTTGMAAAGGGMAGLLGGLVYGFAGMAQAMGEVSALLVLIALCAVVGLAGGGAVGLGVACIASLSRPYSALSILGGAVGGLVIGALARLVGTDAFTLLLGRAPGAFTGAMEGLLLGGGVGLGLWIARRMPGPISVQRAMVAAGLATAAAGEIVVLLGGRLMAGSLALVSQQFPGSRLDMNGFGALFGETGFGLISQMLTAAMEGALFGGGVAGAIVLASRGITAGHSAAKT